MPKKDEKGLIVFAVKEESSQETKKDEPYKISWFDKIPFWFKAIFIKYWDVGVIYFFVDMGLSNLIFGETTLNITSGQFYLLILISGLLYGLSYFFIAGFLIELCEVEDGQGRNYMICYSKKVYALWIDMLYGLLWSLITHVIALKIVAQIPTDSWARGIFQEPFSFALIGFVVDLAFVGLKDLGVYSYKKITRKEAI